jgi:hypothetical protein
MCPDLSLPQPSKSQMPKKINLDSIGLWRSTQTEVLRRQDKVYSHSTPKKIIQRSSKHACLVLFSSFCAIGAGLKCGVHPHQVLATSSSTLSNAHENYSHFNDNHPLRLIVNSDSEGARFGSSKSQTTLRNKPSQLIVKLISIMISEGGQAPQMIMKSLILNSDGA